MNLNLLQKTITLCVHPEDVAFGGRGEIAHNLTKELARGVYENMKLKDIENSELMEMSITVYFEDNRAEWRDRHTFTESYILKEHNETQ